MSEYTPVVDTYHDTITMIENGEDLDSTNLSKAEKDLADNTQIIRNEIVAARGSESTVEDRINNTHLAVINGFVNSIGRVFGAVRLEGLGVTVATGTVTLAAGKIVKNQLYVDFAGDSWAQLSADKVVFLKFDAIDEFGATVTAGYEDALPSDDADTIHIKLADVNTAGDVTMSLDLLGDQLGDWLTATWKTSIDDSLTKRHTQNTDTGTSNAGFQLQAPTGPRMVPSGDDIHMKNAGQSAYVDVFGKYFDADTGYKIGGVALAAQDLTQNAQYTTESSFRVGGPSGREVQLVSDAPATPLKLRLHDINPIPGKADSGTAKVHLRWGWQDLTGAHNGADAADTIRVTGVLTGGLALDVSADELIGQYLYSPSFTNSSKKYEILDNTATSAGSTTLTLESAYDNESMTDQGVIIADADSLEIQIIPYDDPTYEYEDAIIRKLEYDYVIRPQFVIDLSLFNKDESQAFYDVRVRCKKKDGTLSAWHNMAAGSYDPDHGAGGQADVNYTDPFECKLPDLDTDGTLTLLTTTGGFSYEVSGWSNGGDKSKTAHYIEMAWTKESAVNWNDLSNAEQMITKNRKGEIATASSAQLAVAVRPLQNKQVVHGTPQSGKVVSGAMGVAPGDQPVANGKEFDIRTFSGTVSIVSGNQVKLGGTPKIPADGATNADLKGIRDYIKNSGRTNVIKDSAGKEFRISRYEVSEDGTDVTMNLDPIDGISTPTAGAGEINTTEAGRQITVMNAMQIEYEGVEASLELDEQLGATVGDPATVRVAQNSTAGKADADHITGYQSGSSKQQSLDSNITSGKGNLGLVIDAFDDAIASPNNKACISGKITVNMRPRVKGGRAAR